MCSRTGPVQGKTFLVSPEIYPSETGEFKEFVSVKGLILHLNPGCFYSFYLSHKIGPWTRTRAQMCLGAALVNACRTARKEALCRLKNPCLAPEVCHSSALPPGNWGWCFWKFRLFQRKSLCVFLIIIYTRELKYLIFICCLLF